MNKEYNVGIGIGCSRINAASVTACQITTRYSTENSKLKSISDNNYIVSSSSTMRYITPVSYQQLHTQSIFNSRHSTFNTTRGCSSSTPTAACSASSVVWLPSWPRVTCVLVTCDTWTVTICIALTNSSLFSLSLNARIVVLVLVVVPRDWWHQYLYAVMGIN